MSKAEKCNFLLLRMYIKPLPSWHSPPQAPFPQDHVFTEGFVMEGMEGWQLLQCPAQVTSDFSRKHPTENVAKGEADCSKETYSPLCKTCRVWVCLEDGPWSGWLWSGQCRYRADLSHASIASSLPHTACEPLTPFQLFPLVEILLTHLNSPKRWDFASDFFFPVDEPIKEREIKRWKSCELK